MRGDMANKRPLVMTNEDWKKHRNATECHICDKSLCKDLFLDSMAIYAKANNPRVEGYDPTQPKNYITYLEASNLY